MTNEGLEAKVIDYLVLLESKTRRLRESKFDPKELYWEDIRGILNAPIHLSDADKYEVRNCCEWGFRKRDSHSVCMYPAGPHQAAVCGLNRIIADHRIAQSAPIVCSHMCSQ